MRNAVCSQTGTYTLLPAQRRNTHSLDTLPARSLVSKSSRFALQAKRKTQHSRQARWGNSRSLSLVTYSAIRKVDDSVAADEASTEGEPHLEALSQQQTTENGKSDMDRSQLLQLALFAGGMGSLACGMHFAGVRELFGLPQKAWDITALAYPGITTLAAAFTYWLHGMKNDGGDTIANAMGGYETENPRLKELVADVWARSGLPGDAPRAFEIPSGEPNAFAAGTRGSVIAVTTGLLELLSEGELRAVLAHEVGHLRNRDVNRSVQSSALRFKSSRKAEFAADAFASSIGEGPELASALEKIGAETEVERDALGAASGAFAHTYLDNPPARESPILTLGGLLRTHPRTEERVQRLIEAEDEE